jgi:molybdenum cofactor biosynthesis protein MoaC
MIDITHKIISLRTAQAQAKVICAETTVERIRKGNLPKGNLLDIAKAAALLAAKKTPDLIPHCHPVSLDYLDVVFDVQDDGVLILVTGKSIARTGLEMEVLTAASIAALTIYDLLKPIDKYLEITNVRLLGKTGGKTQHRKDSVSPDGSPFTAAILVASDSTAMGKREDKSGIIIKDALESYGVNVVEYKILPDNADEIEDMIRQWVDRKIHFIFTTGGTGMSPRDVTVEAAREVITTEVSGIAEAMRGYGGMRTPRAMLSRAVSGVSGESVIVTLPGSSGGATDGMNALLPGLFHARSMILGGGH